MSLKTPLPFFPLAPEGYDTKYFNEVVRSFSVFLNQFRNTQQIADDDSTALNWFLS
jgi:hypothetical protein